MVTHALLESASGYAVFEVKHMDDIGAKTEAAQNSIVDLAKFSKIVNLLSFSPFKSAAQALENANDISEGKMSSLSPLFIAGRPEALGGGGTVFLAVSCCWEDVWGMGLDLVLGNESRVWNVGARSLYEQVGFWCRKSQNAFVQFLVILSPYCLHIPRSIHHQHLLLPKAFSMTT